MKNIKICSIALLAIGIIGIKSCSKDKESFYDKNSVVEKIEIIEPDSIVKEKESETAEVLQEVSSEENTGEVETDTVETDVNNSETELELVTSEESEEESTEEEPSETEPEIEPKASESEPEPEVSEPTGQEQEETQAIEERQKQEEVAGAEQQQQLAEEEKKNQEEAEEQQRQQDEAAAAEQKLQQEQQQAEKEEKDRQEAAEQQRLQEEAAAAEEKRKQEEAAAEEKRKQEEAAELQRQQDEAQKRQEEAAEKERQEEQLRQQQAEEERQRQQESVDYQSRLEYIVHFPSNHPLNQNISGSPVDANSEEILTNIGNNVSLFADFGSGNYKGEPIGVPFVAVGGNQTKVPIIFRANGSGGNHGNESDQGPFPIPLDAPIEAEFAFDRHVIAVDVDNGMLYELYNAEQFGDGWAASSAAVFNLNTIEFRPDGWTSADASGLPIFPLLVRYEEVRTGEINHAIRFSLDRSKIYEGYVHPARHLISGEKWDGLLPFGGRLRLKADFDISSFSQTNQIILRAMKKHGLILADVGRNMFIKGGPHESWDNYDLKEIRKIKVSDFEVIELGNITER